MKTSRRDIRVFGYDSLVSKESAEKTIGRVITDFQYMTLKGYKREFNAVYNDWYNDDVDDDGNYTWDGYFVDNPESDVASHISPMFLNIAKDSASDVYGCTFMISEDEFDALDKREEGYTKRRVLLIDDNGNEHWSLVWIFSYVNDPLTAVVDAKDYKIASPYYDVCMNAHREVPQLLSNFNTQVGKHIVESRLYKCYLNKHTKSYG